MELKTGGLDGWSRTKKENIINALGQEAWDAIAANLADEKMELSAAKWTLRGLKLSDAIRKAMVDREVTDNYEESLKKTGASLWLTTGLYS